MAKVEPNDDTIKPQAEKFRDLARKLECDEGEAKFEDQVRRVATAPKPQAKPD